MCIRDSRLLGGAADRLQRTIRDDDAVLAESGVGTLVRRPREPVTVGRDEGHLLVAALDEHAVQLRAHFVGRSRIGGARDQARERVAFELHRAIGLQLGNPWELGGILDGERRAVLALAVPHLAMTTLDRQGERSLGPVSYTHL